MFHGDGDITWVSRKRWDYFVQNLLGETPPSDFVIQKPPKEEIDIERLRRKRH